MMDAAEIVPLSIWEKVLKQSAVAAPDILSFCSTSKRLYGFLLHNSAVWRSKVAQKWPSLKKQLDNCLVQNWFEIYRQRHSMISVAKNSLDELAARFIKDDVLHLSDTAFGPMVESAIRFDLGHLFLIDELRYILNETPPRSRLTHKYYASSAIRYLTQQTLIPRWNEWLQGGQQLETGAFLFAQWFQPTLCLDEASLTHQLDRMAEETRRKLSEINKRHPLLRDRSIDHANLRETVWSPSETREIIDALNFVFSILNGFRGNLNDYYIVENSFLNKVIHSKLGIPITLCILYHAMARRLGVYCVPVNFPSHFLLKFLDHPELSESQKYTYIDVFNSCRLMREDQVWATHAPPSLRRDRSYFVIPDSVSVLVRMINNIAHVEQSFRPADSAMKRSAWELGVVLKPMDFDMRLALVRKYFRLDVNIEKIVELMETAPEPLDDMQRVQKQHFIEMARARLLTVAIYGQDSAASPKLRSEYPHVKFATGMILRHKQYDYTCVVSGWDQVCAAADSWKLQMGVQNLPRKDNQPFYHVLVHDGTNRYAAEENLVFAPNPVPVTHSEVGKYFQECCATRGTLWYKMNNQRKQEYPEDEEATVRYAETAWGKEKDTETG